MGSLSPWHLLILVGVLVLLFGAKKLPDAARGLGRSLKILKAETRDLREDEDSDAVQPDAKQLRLDDMKQQQADRRSKYAG
jgi:sec-independent protein translocase protein TatA